MTSLCECCEERPATYMLESAYEPYNLYATCEVCNPIEPSEDGTPIHRATL